MTVRQKIPLADQIEFMTVIRDSFEGLVREGVRSTNGMDMETKRDRSEAILLTLSMYAEFETEFRAFMAERSNRNA